MCNKIIATAVLAAAAYMPLVSAATVPDDIKGDMKRLPLHWESVEQPNIAKAAMSGKKMPVIITAEDVKKAEKGKRSEANNAVTLPTPDNDKKPVVTQPPKETIKEQPKEQPVEDSWVTLPTKDKEIKVAVDRDVNKEINKETEARDDLKINSEVKKAPIATENTHQEIKHIEMENVAEENIVELPPIEPIKAAKPAPAPALVVEKPVVKRPSLVDVLDAKPLANNQNTEPAKASYSDTVELPPVLPLR